MNTVLVRGLFGALLIGGAVAMAPAAALAGSCPAGKQGVDVRKPDNTPARDVTDTVISSIDVAKEPADIQDRQFRMRRLEVNPGGVVPWHSHEDRPAIIYIVKGEITEYASTCSAPILHKAGDSTAETARHRPLVEEHRQDHGGPDLRRPAACERRRSAHDVRPEAEEPPPETFVS